MKSKIITVAGALGSGKSSTAKGIASELGYRHFSSGDLFRTIAAERGLTIMQINQQAELEHEIDYAVDKKLQDMATEEDLVIDSRMAYHWMPNSFKVYVSLESQIAAERIYKQIQNEGRVSEDTKTLEEVAQSILERQASEQKRYWNLYKVDALDLSPFDLVVDTATKPLNEVIQEIITSYRQWLAADQ
jgi:cytidylate kinase